MMEDPIVFWLVVVILLEVIGILAGTMGKTKTGIAFVLAGCIGTAIGFFHVLC